MKNDKNFIKIKKILQFEKVSIAKDNHVIGYLKTLKLLTYLTLFFIFVSYSMINKDRIQPTFSEKKSIFKIMINN